MKKITKSLLYVAFGAVLCVGTFMTTQAEAMPVIGFGTGNAVISVDRAATFDTLTSDHIISLAGYSEDMLNITVNDDQFSDVDPFNGQGGGAYSGFHYGAGGNSSFVTISATDNADFLGLEFLLGTGWPSNTIANVVWETFSNGSSTGSGIFSTVEGAIVGWSDVNGFDTLTVGAYGQAYTAFGQHQSIALDNLSVQLLSPVSQVPVPAALPLFGTGLAVMGFVGWRRKRKVS